MKRFLFIIIFAMATFTAIGQEKIVRGEYFSIGNYVFEHDYGVTYKCFYVYTENGLKMMKSGSYFVPLEERTIIKEEEAKILVDFINTHRQELGKKYHAFIMGAIYLRGEGVCLRIQDITEYQEEERKVNEKAAKEEKARQERLNSLANMF